MTTPNETDLDWLRSLLTGLEERSWARPVGPEADSSALHDAIAGLRSVVGVGDPNRLASLRRAWAAQVAAGGADLDDQTIAALVRADDDSDVEVPFDAEEGIATAADLDWIRRQIVELDDRQRALPPTDIAARHALLEATDGLRAILRNGHADQIHAVREGWEARAGRKGGHEVDPEMIAGYVRGMVSSQGAAGT